MLFFSLSLSFSHFPSLVAVYSFFLKFFLLRTRGWLTFGYILENNLLTFSQLLSTSIHIYLLSTRCGRFESGLPELFFPAGRQRRSSNDCRISWNLTSFPFIRWSAALVAALAIESFFCHEKNAPVQSVTYNKGMAYKLHFSADGCRKSFARSRCSEN